jgi:Amt family ammonium transporter
MLVSTGLVLLMVPGLALFYGGMVRRKNVLGTMMHSMVALGIIGIQWVLIGYCLAFGETHQGVIGWSPRFIGLNGVGPAEVFYGTNIPIFVHCMYQGMFAIITPALIAGAFAERIKFGPYCLFILLWATLVYDPLAHWVWAVEHKAVDPDFVGLLGGKAKALDFAGGTVVHIAAGLSGLAAILALRKRVGYPEHPIHPNSMVLTLLGAGILWFGWFGFNGGSALASNAQAGSALAASQVAAAAASLAWAVVEWMHRGKPTALGFASGLVAGLVAVTPASGFITPLSAVIIGLLAGAVCYAAVAAKPFFKYDDSLDAFGVHGIGGLLGALLTGVLANMAFVNQAIGKPETNVVGALDKGVSAQFTAQLIASGASIVYAFVVSFVLIKLIDGMFGFCVEPATEAEGLDRSQHGEIGFDLGPALELVPQYPEEPRAADLPPNGQKRFTVVVEGPGTAELMHTWSNLCQAGSQPVAQEFKEVYPFVTTVQGNRFRFRGGVPTLMRDNLKKLFENRLKGTEIRTHIEN